MQCSILGQGHNCDLYESTALASFTVVNSILAKWLFDNVGYLLSSFDWSW